MDERKEVVVPQSVARYWSGWSAWDNLGVSEWKKDTTGVQRLLQHLLDLRVLLIALFCSFPQPMLWKA